MQSCCPMLNKMQVVSLFSGAGGLDLGFHQAGFSTVWANEFDSTIWRTFEHNFPKVKLDKRDIKDVLATEVPNSLGIIGGHHAKVGVKQVLGEVLMIVEVGCFLNISEF